MCFSAKVMDRNVFLQYGSTHNAPVFGQYTLFFIIQTAKNLGIGQGLSKHMQKLEHIPAEAR